MSVQDLLNYIAIQDPSSAFSKSVTEDIDGTVLERLEYIANRVVSIGNGRKVSGSGYLVYPSAAAGIDPANAGSAWANGSYSEVVASTGQANYIVGLSWSEETNAEEWELDIATGAAASETVVSTISGAAWLGGLGHIVFLSHPIAVATTTRIAIRLRSSNTTLETKDFKLIYVKQSELVAL